jgi:SepF-like predicted cell division protein (DUF552 family)
MRAFKRIFQRPSGTPEGVQVVESEVKEERLGIEPIYIKSMNLESSEDLKKVGDELRAGNIVILNIASFMSRDVEGLKQAIAQLKGMCYAIGGDIGRLGDSWIVATPKYVTIQFREQGTGPVT